MLGLRKELLPLLLGKEGMRLHEVLKQVGWDRRFRLGLE